MAKSGLILIENTTDNLLNAPKNYRKASANLSLELAKFAVNTIKRNIRMNLIQPPKSEATAKRSRSKVTLIDTRKYVNGLKALKSGDGAVIDGDHILATLLEGGTKNMRARPHIRPALKQVTDNLGNLAGQSFIEDLFG